MRTRFLNTDYFTSYPSPEETLSFLKLPIPHLPPRLLSFEEDFSRFDSQANISLEVERLPIDSALSKFISQVIPEIIDVDFEDFEDHQFRNAKLCADEQRKFSWGSDEIRYSEVVDLNFRYNFIFPWNSFIILKFWKYERLSWSRKDNSHHYNLKQSNAGTLFFFFFNFPIF